MKHEQKSLIMTIWIVKAMMVLLPFIAVGMPFIVGWYTGMREELYPFYWPTLVLAACCLIPAAIALYCMDRLLCNIKKADVFISENTEYLRKISWCAYVASLIFFILGFMRPIGFVIAFAGFFVGLILRVVKNVFAQAVLIREENEFTI